jgi:[acyl-carrier-protein] S-malonyltransferase
MTTPWLEAFPRTCKPFLEEMDEVLQSPLSRIITEGSNSKINSTENSQPAIMAVSIMVLRVLEVEFGFKTSEKIDVVLGHSLGEFAAIVAAGCLDFRDSLRIIRRRAEAMRKCTHDAEAQGNGTEYGMVALIVEPNRLPSLIDTIEEFLGHSPFPPAGSDLDVDGTRPAIEQVTIANMNSKNQIVLSGEIQRINELLVQLRQFGGHDPRAVRLNADSPFHSPIMKEAKVAMQKLLAKTNVTFPGQFPIISNVSARPITSAENLRDLLARQAVETVRWWDSIKYLDQEMGVRRWVGIGPGKVGRNLVGKEVGMRGIDTVRGGGVWGISKPEEVEMFLREFEKTNKEVEES